MFTGIIQDVGRVRSLTRRGEAALLEASAPRVSSELHPGDSVAINGVCLTVTRRDGKGFQADLSRRDSGAVQSG